LADVVHFKTGDQASEGIACDGKPADVLSPRLRLEAAAFDPLDLAGAWPGDEPLEDLMKQL
jgi:hypothetical protein